jgi:hypothetical protein
MDRQKYDRFPRAGPILCPMELIVRNVHVLDLDVPGLVRGPVDLSVRDGRIGQISDVAS